VLFRENVLHRAEHGFGHGKKARLTQTFFFQAIPYPSTKAQFPNFETLGLRPSAAVYNGAASLLREQDAHTRSASLSRLRRILSSLQTHYDTISVWR